MEISTQNYQIVFLLDLLNSAQKDSNEVDIVKNAAALKSTVLKILSFFAGKRGTADSLKWGYSYISEKLYVQRYEFKEFKLKQFEEFEQDVEHKIQDLSTKEANTIETLSSALKIVSQNFCWDQPDLSSPVRRKPKTYFTQNKKTRKQNSVNEIPVTKQRNIVFVVAPCPDSEHMLQQFVGSKTTISSKMLKDKLMVDDRLFRDINIQLYWIDTNVSFLQKSVNIAHDIKGITMLSTLLQNNLNGMVIPVNALLQCGRHATTTIQSALGITSHFHNQSEENSNPSHPDSKDHTDGHLCNASKSDNQLESNNDSSELLSRNNFKQRMTSFPLPLSAILDYYTKPNRYSDDSSQSRQVCLCKRKRDETLEVFCQLEMQDFCPQRVLGCNNSKTDTVSAPASCVNSNLKSVEVAAAVSVKKDTNTSTLLSVDVVDQDVKPQDGFMYICGVIPSSSISVDMCNQSHAYGCIGLEQSLEGGCTAEKQLSLWYQNLLTILSKKNLSLVVEFMDLFSGLPVTAVLQPLTFSMATLRLILPEKVIYLDKSLIFGFSQTENGEVNEEKEHHPPVSSLMQDLQQLYWKEQQKDKDDKMEKEQELRMKQHDTDEPKKLKPKRTIKRNNSQALIRGNLMVDKSREVIKKQIHKNSSDNKKIEAERLSVDLKMRRQEIEKKVQTQEFKDKEDLLSQLNEKYEEALLKPL
uniref:Uncharacterized protein LOC102806922 n=1 Tax=Saccoglossus kowalevskii TaxID=10224 RepID=A0ABM0LUG6_SACKO|nr:PREDICTED: uncharacterized protein LOC102806922 [Saccoglossus kowalevskii]